MKTVLILTTMLLSFSIEANSIRSEVTDPREKTETSEGTKKQKMEDARMEPVSSSGTVETSGKGSKKRLKKD